MAKDANREEDLFILNIAELEREKKSVNVLSCGLDSLELGKFLVLAGRSAGADVSEPFWFSVWSDLFTGTVMLLHHNRKPLTMRTLLACLRRDKDGKIPIQELAAKTKEELQKILGEKKTKEDRDKEIAVSLVERFYAAENRTIRTVETLISTAFGAFEFSRYDCFSPPVTWLEETEKAKKFQTFYDQIIQDGKIVLVSISAEDPTFAKTLCTLVKCLFQQTVRSRLGRYWSTRDKTTKYNFTRPLVLACDEYSQVASEIPGQPIGDGDFFSICRQNGCMGLVATQSVHMLETSSLGKSWRGLFSNFGAKIFMRLVDNETIEEASKLAGKSDWYIAAKGITVSPNGMSDSSQTSMQQREALAVQVLTGLNQGEGVMIGFCMAIKVPPLAFSKCLGSGVG